MGCICPTTGPKNTSVSHYQNNLKLSHEYANSIMSNQVLSPIKSMKLCLSKPMSHSRTMKSYMMIPIDYWRNIIDYLDYHDLTIVRKCNKALKELCKSPAILQKLNMVNQQDRPNIGAFSNLTLSSIPNATQFNFLSINHTLNTNTVHIKNKTIENARGNKRISSINHAQTQSHMVDTLNTNLINNHINNLPTLTILSSGEDKGIIEIERRSMTSNCIGDKNVGNNHMGYTDCFTNKRLDLSSKSPSKHKLSISNKSFSYDRTPSFSENTNKLQGTISIMNITNINVTPVIIHNANSINSNKKITETNIPIIKTDDE